MSKVLLVVESHVIQGMIEKILVPHYEITSTVASVAVEKFNSVQPETVLLDLSLCSNDGVDLLQRLNKEDPTVRVILLARRDEEALVRSKLQQGVFGWIAKEDITISDPERRKAFKTQFERLLRT